MQDGHTTDTGETSQILAIFDDIWERKNTFFMVFFIMLCISYGFLVWIDFIPETPEAIEEAFVVPVLTATTSPATEDDVTTIAVAPNPVRIHIEKIATDVAVLNPVSSEISDLDNALLKGVVRHPDSADFADTGTMVLFGHSSYLPQVFNQNFKAFNGIQKLAEGDAVTVDSSDARYEYRVTKVYKVAASQASVPLEKGTPKLILVTCNSFGSKDDRYVVEAEFVKKDLL